MIGISIIIAREALKSKIRNGSGDLQVVISELSPINVTSTSMTVWWQSLLLTLQLQLTGELRVSEDSASYLIVVDAFDMDIKMHVGRLGILRFPSITLNEVITKLHFQTRIDELDQDVFSEFIGDFLHAGESDPIPIWITGSTELTVSTPLGPISATRNFEGQEIKVPGIRDKLVGKVTVDAIHADVDPYFVWAESTLILHNPLSIAFVLQSLNFSVYFNDSDGAILLPPDQQVKLADVHSTEPITVEPFQSVSQNIDLITNSTTVVVRVIDEVLKKKLTLDILDGVMSVSVNVFTTSFHFEFRGLVVSST